MFLIPSFQACQAKCKALDDCDHFIFHGVAKKCSLYSGQHTRAMAGGTAGQNYISGPKACADPGTFKDSGVDGMIVIAHVRT